MQIFKDDKIKLPIKSWCNNPEQGAINQARNLANLPFAFKQIVLCPDVHQGFGMPIGGVLATKNAMVISAVGSDIGCGVCSLESNISEWHINDLKQIIKKLNFTIPTGFSRHLKPKNEEKLPEIKEDKSIELSKLHFEKFYEQSLYYLGTLGGGNHFIELQKNRAGNLCIMIHSGSRNLGFRVAEHYNKIAKEINEKYFSKIPSDWGLSFLPMDSEEGNNYLFEMQYCVDFALANRREMMRAVEEAIYDVFKPRQKVEFSNFINIPHNYARLENHFGTNVYVHRKGSTSARKGEIGLIPGSQGTKSYIVRGLGNKESFESCSHGAGRIMGRNEARKRLDLKREIDKLNALGVIHDVKSEIDLDEAPSSYKDINIVMEEQKDLVEIVDEFTPLAVIKAKSKERKKKR